MSNMIQIDSQYTPADGSQDSVDYGTLKIADAQPTNFAPADVAFVADATDNNGKRYRVTYGFSQSEADEAGEDASSLPWDAGHVARCEEA